MAEAKKVEERANCFDGGARLSLSGGRAGPLLSGGRSGLCFPVEGRAFAFRWKAAPLPFR